MSKFIGNNELNSIGIFRYRSLYDEEILNHQALSAKSINLWNQKLFYGKINYQKIPIFVKEDKLISANINKQVFAINFVVDAFNDLKNKIQEYSFRKKINIDNSFLTNFSAQQGWISIHKLYNEHISSIYTIFIQEYCFKQYKNNKITSFDSFLSEFESFLSLFLIQTPFSFSSFLLSKFTSILNSGLALEIDFQNHDFDDQKVEKFINDKNFIIYSKIAQECSFFIDKNAPWRLIFNIRSPKSFKYLEKYNINIHNIFDFCFFESTILDIDYLSYYIEKFYSSLIELSPIIERPVLLSDNSIKTTIFSRSKYSFKENNKLFEYYSKIFLQEFFDQKSSSQFNHLQKKYSKLQHTLTNSDIWRIFVQDVINTSLIKNNSLILKKY